MTPDIVPAPSALRGIGLKVGSVALFCAMAALLKAVSDEVPAGEMVFFRSAFGIVPILVALWVSGELFEGLRTNRPILHVRRGVMGTASMAFNFLALANLPLPEATVLGYAAPILVVIFAALLLGERIRLVRISAVVLGMIGVLVVLWPQLGGGGGSARGAAYALCSATLGALVAIQIRMMVGTERASAIVFWFSLTATVLSLLTLPFGWVMPTPAQALCLVLAGLVGGTAQILMTSAYRYADASLIAPFEYVSILIALVLGYVFFAEVPSWWTLGGSAIIVAAGVIIILRERQLGHRRQANRPLEH
uniref:DMT family transporter n=1 Tax=Paenirhodobacter enshiensis TaxID=1105367 RepID=UPI0035AE83FB